MNGDLTHGKIIKCNYYVLSENSGEEEEHHHGPHNMGLKHNLLNIAFF